MSGLSRARDGGISHGGVGSGHRVPLPQVPRERVGVLVNLTRVEWEWVAAAAAKRLGVTLAKVWPDKVDGPDLWRRLVQDHELPPRQKTCPKCGSRYTHYCVDCCFRSGGRVVEDRRPPAPDLLDKFARAQSDPEALRRGMREAGWNV